MREFLFTIVEKAVHMIVAALFMYLALLAVARLPEWVL